MDSKMLIRNKSLSQSFTYRKADESMMDRKDRSRISSSYVDKNDLDSLDPSYLPKIK